MSMTLEELIRFHTEEAEKMKLHRKVNEIILGTETYEIKLQEHTQTAEWLKELAERRKQPEIIRCKKCIFYDPPHVENKGVRIEYKDLPKEAFDVLGAGLVSAEYGINIGGRCCVDYYCKNYSDDKRVYVREDNYCGRAKRGTDENTV